MKKYKGFAVFLSSLFLISSCSLLPNNSNSEVSSTSDIVDSVTNSESYVDSNNDTSSEGYTNSNDVTSSETYSSSESKTDSSSIKVEKDKLTFDIYSINDFHGHTKYKQSSSYPEIGLAKMSTIFDEFRNKSTSFFISVGDSWQETYESNSNRGAYVTEAMNYIGFDSMTLGNHEFDWGVEYIESNSKLADFPFLCANLIDKRTNERPEWVKGSTIIERDDFKLGVIGTIGEDQYNSITASFVVNYEFASQHDYVVKEAESLKEQGANMILWASHEPLSSTGKEVYLTSTKKQIIEDAGIDAVLSAHTHLKEYEIYKRNDGTSVPILQAYSYGKDYGNLNYTYDFNTDELTFNSYSINDFKKYVDYEEDSRITSLYKEKYDVDDELKEEICSVTGNLSTKIAAKMASTLCYSYMNNKSNYKNYDIKCFLHNNARVEIAQGTLTFEGLFNSFCFDNEIIIYQVTTSYSGFDYYNVNKEFNKSSLSGTFYVAAINYVAYKKSGVLDSGIRTGLYVRDILKEELKELGSINSSNYNY